MFFSPIFSALLNLYFLSKVSCYNTYIYKEKVLKYLEVLVILNRRAQTATEYLIIAAVVIILAVLVVTILGDSLNIGGANDRGDLLAYMVQDVAVTDFSWHGGSVLMTVQNNRGGIIDIDYININNKFCAMTDVDYAHQTYYAANNCGVNSSSCVTGLNGSRLLEPELFSYLAMVRLSPGQTRTFRCFNVENIRPNDKYSAVVSLAYTEVATGAQYFLDNSNIFIKGRGATSPTYDNTSVLIDYLTPGDTTPYSLSGVFGTSSAISANGEYIAIGGSFRNAVYVFKNSGSTWNQQAKLQASDSPNSGGFGGGYLAASRSLSSGDSDFTYATTAVAISDDGSVLVVGAPEKNSGSIGTAYVFRRSGSNWVQDAQLNASDQATIRYFGSTVAISGDGNRIVVSSPVHTGSQGRAYVYAYNGGVWSEEQILTYPSIAFGHRLGYAMALDSTGSTLVATTPFTLQGSAQVFTRTGTTWTHLTTLSASNGVNNYYFGVSADISGSGDTIVVGNYHWSGGSVYVYRKQGSSWSQDQIITATGTPTTRNFGSQVSLSPDGSKLFTTMFASQIGSSGCVYGGLGYIYSLQGNTYALRTRVGNNKIYTSNCNNLWWVGGTYNPYNFYGRFPVAISDNGIAVMTSTRTNVLVNNLGSMTGSAAVYGYSGR
jgi:hypothetical protein